MSTRHHLRHVALLTDGIWPHTMGGMQKHTFYLMKGLLEKGIRVSLVHGDKQYDTALFDQWQQDFAGLQVYHVPFPKQGRWPWAYLRASYLHSERIAEQLAHVDGVDVVYAQGFTAWALLRKRKAKHPKVAVNFHGLEMFQFATTIKQKLIQRLFRPAVRQCLRSADLVYSLGGRLTDILQAEAPSTPVSIVSIGIGESWLADTVELSNKNYQLDKAVFIGRYERRKGIEELNEAIADLDLSVEFIGPIPNEKQVNRADWVYHGAVKDEQEIKSIIDQCGVVLLPSLSEGMPTVLLEAMSRGCVVIASDVGAVKDIVSENNGIVVEPGYVPQFREACQRYLSMSDEKRKELGLASHNRVCSSLLWAKVIEANISSMETMIN